MRNDVIVLIFRYIKPFREFLIYTHNIANNHYPALLALNTEFFLTYHFANPSYRMCEN